MGTKSKVIQVRFDEELGGLIERDANRQRLSQSAWIRALVALHYAEELAAASAESLSKAVIGQKR